MGSFDQSGTLANAFKAATAFAPLVQYPNFWQVGCVFDSILDYFLALKESGQLNEQDRLLSKQLLERAVAGYRFGIVGLTAAWYDDWCWWGIAASKSFDPDYEEIFGEHVEFFQSTAADLWGLVDSGDFATVADSIDDEYWANSRFQSNGIKFTKAILSARSQLHIGTRNTWAMIERGATGNGTHRQNVDHAFFTDNNPDKWAVPRFPGGCWQYDFSTLAFPCDDGPAWQNPNPHAQTLGVFQLTLMSGLYLSFCCSLIAAGERKAAEKLSGGAWDRLQSADTYREKAQEVVGYLAEWLRLAPPDSLASVYPKGVLVHERTRTYARLPDGTYPELSSYSDDFFWGGDQGLIMGALTQYRQLAGPERSGDGQPIWETYPPALLTGVFHNMPAPTLPDAVGPYLNLVEDADDYGSGSGVFWRYVMRCCRLDPAFRTLARNDPTIASRAATSGTHVNNWGNSLFQPFNTVAAAIGAWYLLK